MRFIETPVSKSVAVYVGASLFTALMGKVVVTKFFFDYPIVILMLQHATALLLIEVLRLISFVKLAPYSFDRGRHLFIPSLLLAISSWLSIAALEGIGMPGFDAIKRMCPLFIMAAAGILLRRQRFAQIHVIAVGAIAVGACLTVNFEMSLDRFSIFYGLIAAVLQAAAYLQLETLSTTFAPLELVYMHSFNSLVVFLLADIVQDEIRDAFMYMMTSANTLFSTMLFIFLCCGFGLQLATMSCIGTAGALATSVAGNLRACVQMMFAYYCGIYLFYDVTPAFINWIGFLATIAGGYVFYRKYVPVSPNERTFGQLA